MIGEDADLIIETFNAYL